MEKFHMFDDRIYQMTNGVKAADRIIYTVMLNEQKFYHDKGQYYTPSYAHLGQYAGITRTSVIACMKRLEAHGLIKKTNVASNQCVIKVYSLDEVPEVLTELTAKEARKAKLESKVTQSVKKDDPLSQNSLPTESKFFTQSVKIFDTYNNNINNKEFTNNNEEDDFEEESLKKRASLCDSHECDSLDIEEAIKETVKTSDLDDLDSEATKEAVKKEDKIFDVNEVSDQKDTPCRLESTDDELPDVDLDELDDFDDSDDDFTYRPKKKTHTDSKKEKVKVRRVYAGGIK
ncbi:TPA: helix-turn-helix domain-containing protein [Escherichia coli]